MSDMKRIKKGEYVSSSGAQALQQSLLAARMMREMHERMIAEGWKWDGMDGYSKEETRS